MNTISMRSSHLLLAALTAFASPALASSPVPAANAHDHADGAHEHAHGEQPEWAELFGDASLPVVWQSATASSEHITAALGARKTEGVAAWAETIHLAAHALIDQVTLDDSQRKKRLDAALEQAAKIADEVLDAAQHSEHEKASVAFKRLQSALAVARTRLPKEIADAPAGTPRFAEAPEHGDDHGHAH